MKDLSALLQSLNEARTLTDRLFSMVRPDALYTRPVPERHRLVFYFGHLEAFDWNIVRLATGEDKTMDAEFDRLFAFGIDPLDALPSDQPSDWPPLKAIGAYRVQAREAVDRFLPHFIQDPTALFAAIEHRLMHAETFTYLLHRLPVSEKLRIRETIIDVPPPSPRVVIIPEGETTLGRPRREHGGFGWDNEFASQTVRVAEFAIDAYNVTNRQFLEFVSAGGYEERSLWDEASWEWITREGITAPNFWKRTAKGWMYQTMFDLLPLPPSWPVYVSHAEAKAYARWSGRSLPTEAQFHRAGFGNAEGTDESQYPWGNQAPVAGLQGNFGNQSWNPVPVGLHKAGESVWKIFDLMSNGWEWTATVFAPLPGFQPLPIYPQYSADFFDGRHYVLKGASPRTPLRLLRRSFRNWFQPHFANVYATFRCVDN